MAVTEYAVLLCRCCSTGCWRTTAASRRRGWQPWRRPQRTPRRCSASSPCHTTGDPSFNFALESLWTVSDVACLAEVYMLNVHLQFDCRADDFVSGRLGLQLFRMCQHSACVHAGHDRLPLPPSLQRLFLALLLLRSDSFCTVGSFTVKWGIYENTYQGALLPFSAAVSCTFADSNPPSSHAAAQ